MPYEILHNIRLLKKLTYLFYDQNNCEKDINLDML